MAVNPENFLFGILLLTAVHGECPKQWKSPSSGLVISPIPGILLDNVKYIHVPVILSFSSWSFLHSKMCIKAGTATILYWDLIGREFQKFHRSAHDPTLNWHTHLFPNNSAVRTKRSLMGDTIGLLGIGNSIKNSFGLNSFKRSVQQLRAQMLYIMKQEINADILSINEQLITLDNLHSLASLFNTYVHMEHNKYLCNIYAQHTLTQVQVAVSDLLDGKIPRYLLKEIDLRQALHSSCNTTLALIEDLGVCKTFVVRADQVISHFDLEGTDKALQRHFVQGYAVMCSSSNNNSAHLTITAKDGRNISFPAVKMLKFCQCVDWYELPCKSLSVDYSTILNLAVTTPVSIPQRKAGNTMILSFILSVPLFDKATEVYSHTVLVKKIGLLQGNAWLRYKDHPTLIIRRSPTEGWKIPDISCCEVVSFRYICHCRVKMYSFVDTYMYQGNVTKNTNALCLVQLSSWDLPRMESAYAVNNIYCVVTNA
nr:PREDICTED: uncharacterized protein LOC106703303 [Latimeria chalumnae]|eukprot:XP_014343358.1 PREDICTED: uncharacterized protein LOC106703303 [Latimeria chalumnae]